MCMCMCAKALARALCAMMYGVCLMGRLKASKAMVHDTLRMAAMMVDAVAATA